MKCMHCGKEIENDSRFCTFCGGENQPAAVPPMPQQPVMYPQRQPMSPVPPKRKQGGAWKWAVAFVWLALVIVGWVAALLLTIGGRTDEAKENRVENIDQGGALTEGTWYQWDLSTDTLYGWTFQEDGTAVYGIPGKNESSTVAYSVDDSGAVVIGYDDAGVTWEYDSLEDCYWQYTMLDGQLYKTRIFRSTEYPAGNALCYSYRTDDNVYMPVSYENITEMSRDAAQELLRWYCGYGAFGACRNVESVEGQEAEDILRSAGCDPMNYYLWRVTCCSSFAQSRQHLAHYLSDDYLNEEPWSIPIEYNGQLYMAVTPTSFPIYYVDGDITDLGDGTWSAPLRFEEEGDIFRGYTAVFGLENGTIKLLEVGKDTDSGGTMTMEKAQELMNRYNQYMSFGVCSSVESVSEEEENAVLLSAGYDSQYLDMYSVSRVTCCSSIAQCREHLAQYLGGDILSNGSSYEAGPIEYNGRLYMVAAPMGYPGYYIDGSLTNQGGGVWTAPAKFDYEDTSYTVVFSLIDGSFKLISIENAGSPELSEDVA